MRILIVSQYFWPEDYGAGVEVRELAAELVNLGHQVTVVTGLPNYPYGKIQPDYRFPPIRKENIDGVQVIRGWFFTVSRTSGSTRRGLSALSFGLTSFFLGLTQKKPEIILSYSPPIFMGLSARLLARIWNVPWVLNVKDLFTMSILAVGMARNGWLTRLLQRLENDIYLNASHIITNASHFYEYLMDLGLPKEKIDIIPDWADGNFIKPMDHENIIREQWGLKQNFVVMYSGNMGYSSDLETVLKAAERLQDLQYLKFVLVGDGVKLEALRKIARERNIENVQFQPLQPRDTFPEVLAAADVSLVTLSSKGGQVSTQGKLYSIMAAGRTIVAITSPENDIRKIVEDGNCGLWIETGDDDQLTTVLRRLYQLRENVVEYGLNARALFEKNYTLEICVHQFEKVLVDNIKVDKSNAR